VTVEPDIESDPSERLAAHEPSQPACHLTFPLAGKTVPEEIGDHEIENPVAEEFEPLVVARDGTATCFSFCRRRCAGMRQSFAEQCRTFEDMANRLSKILAGRKGLSGVSHAR
jgi:hypothetical protein